jgi:hypothetical protein
MTMMAAKIILADAFTDQVKAATHGRHLESKNLLIGLTAVLVIGLILFVYGYLRVQKKSHEANQERLSQIMRSQSRGTESEGGGRRRKRRRRRDHRPRNPSLDKTGGLPPPRPDDQLPKY